MIKCGIDIGGTNIKLGFFSESNETLKVYSYKTPKKKENILESILNHILRFFSLEEIKGYTVAIPGVLKNGKVIHAPNLDILGLEMEKALKLMLKNENIILENDANLAALAEAKLTKSPNFILVTLGTGIGGGIIMNGTLPKDLPFSGELGHFKVDFKKDARLCGCGKKGCLEMYCSAKNITKDYLLKTNQNINSVELFKRAKAHDLDAFYSVLNSARYLGIALANISSITGINHFKIAGGLSNAGPYFFNLILKFYKQYVISPLEDAKIEQASLGSEAGIYAAKYLI